MNIAIYQVNPDRDENNVAFLNYENLERFQGSAELRSEIYDKVFEGKVDCGTLEEVYQIQDIYAFDLNVFRKNRTEFQRTQPLSESSCDDGIEQGESMSALLKKFSSALSVCDKYSFQSDPRFAWVDEM